MADNDTAPDTADGPADTARVTPDLPVVLEHPDTGGKCRARTADKYRVLAGLGWRPATD